VTIVAMITELSADQVFSQVDNRGIGKCL